MSYFFNDNTHQNEIYENEFYYSLGLEFPLSKKVYSYKNKVSYSKEKKIWFVRYKQDNTYFYLFGYNYGSDRQLDTKDPILILKFNLFNAPNMGNGHFAEDNTSDEVRAVMDIHYKNYRSQQNSENLKSISPIIVNSENYLDLGNIRDGKELCKNIEVLLDEIESIFFFKRHLNRIQENAPLKDKKQTVSTIGVIKKQNENSENVKKEVVETSSEVILEPEKTIIKCDFCGSEILNEDPFKICKACRIRISNYLDLLCTDFEINTKIPLENLLVKAEEHNLSRNNINDIIKTLTKYKYLHKINKEYRIYYNNELRNFIDKYSTKTANNNEDIENKVILVAEKIGLNTPFDITYLKEELNFKNSEISRMIKYLDEKNAIIEDGENYILVDKSNEINGINARIMENNVKVELSHVETTEEQTAEINSIDEKSTSEKNIAENNSVETSNEKPAIELKPIKTNNKTDIEIFYESYEKVLTYMKNNVQIDEISSKLGISENRLNIWIEKGKQGKTPYRLLSNGIKKLNETRIPKINVHKWKKIIEDIKTGFNLFEAANRANIPYPVLHFHITKGKEGESDYKEYYEDYQNAVKSHGKEEIKTHNRCQICNEFLSDETKVICDECESKKEFAVDLKILLERLNNKAYFTKEDLIIYYSDYEISKLINNLKKYDLILETSSIHNNYLKMDYVVKFLDIYFDAKNSNKIKSGKNMDLVKETRKPKKILLAKSKNTPYPFTGLSEDHKFIRPSGSLSKFTLEDVISIHDNYYEDLYSVEQIAKKMELSQLTIKKLIVRFDAGDFDKFIEITEKEKQENISICECCNKEFEPTDNEKYCKNCLIISSPIDKNKFNIILQTEPEIVIGTVDDENFAKEICSIGLTELHNNMSFEEVINNLKEVIVDKKREEIKKIINDEEEPLFEIQENSPSEFENNFKTSTKTDSSKNKIITSTKTDSSKNKIITSIKKELINGIYSELRFTGRLPNNEIDSSIMQLLNEFKAKKRELKLIPINENNSKIIFYLISKNTQTTTNLEILKEHYWQLKTKK